MFHLTRCQSSAKNTVSIKGYTIVPNTTTENTADLRKIVPNGAIGWHEYTSCSHKRRRQMAPRRGATKEDDDDMDVAAVAEGGRAIIRGS